MDTTAAIRAILEMPALVDPIRTALEQLPLPEGPTQPDDQLHLWSGCRPSSPQYAVVGPAPPQDTPTHALVDVVDRACAKCLELHLEYGTRHLRLPYLNQLRHLPGWHRSITALDTTLAATADDPDALGYADVPWSACSSLPPQPHHTAREAAAVASLTSELDRRVQAILAWVDATHPGWLLMPWAAETLPLEDRLAEYVKRNLIGSWAPDDPGALDRLVARVEEAAAGPTRPLAVNHVSRVARRPMRPLPTSCVGDVTVHAVPATWASAIAATAHPTTYAWFDVGDDWVTGEQLELLHVAVSLWVDGLASHEALAAARQLR